ncbi:MAG: hypothetical protein NC453_25510 [Muribaculum sp.]|nr:hypothetical protein [Muribaculum sp.]
MKEKIENQNEKALASNGRFNSTRIGSLLFDFYYIAKHPIVGNGIHSRTRYADHPFLVKQWKNGKEAYSGNALSGQFAKMGVLFYVIFIIYFIKRHKYLSKKELTITFIILFLLLMGEPLFEYPFLLAFPFIDYKSIARIYYKHQLCPQ